jgi:type II secretory pathway pseudopilin PulG
MKKGFSLLTAVIFLVVIATISILALSLSTESAKTTTDDYLKVQAELLAKSATEYAILAMSGHDYSSNCLENILIKYPESTNYTHEANISISYIGSNLPCNASHILSNSLATDDSNRTVIIDTIVTTNPNISTEQIRIHRRTIQKP